MPALLVVVIEDPAELETLADQTIESVELIAHGAASHDPAVRAFAASRGWEYRQRNSLGDAVRFAKTEFIVSWSGIDSADPALIEDLIEAARRHPEFAGATAPHFDGISLWRVAAFHSSTEFERGYARGTLRGFSSRGQGLAPGLTL